MIEKIKLGEKEVILVGTAHISKESIELAQKTIEDEKPDVVGVELDLQRMQQLLTEKKWKETNLTEVIKSGKTYLFLMNVLLSNMQKQIGANVGIKPGAEMLAAVKIAGKNKIPIQLLDRDIKITLKRAFARMKLVEKAKLGWALIAGMFGVGEKVTAQTIEDLKKEDMVNKLMNQLGEQMPSIKKVLVDERDDYISEMIRRSKGKKIVAVLGAGHLKGIKKNLKSKKKININKLNTIKENKSILFKIVKYIIPAIFVLMLGFGFYTKGLETTFHLLVAWFLITGTFSAIGALFSRPHPITLLVAFLSAPLTTLHPALAAGWFAAISETKYNSPKVKDFESLSGVSSAGGFYRNKVTHILIVASFTNIGATIGVLVALPYFFSLIA